MDSANESIQSQVSDAQKVVENWQQCWTDWNGESALLSFRSAIDIDMSSDNANDDARDEYDQGQDNGNGGKDDCDVTDETGWKQVDQGSQHT